MPVDTRNNRNCSHEQSKLPSLPRQVYICLVAQNVTAGKMTIRKGSTAIGSYALALVVVLTTVNGMRADTLPVKEPIPTFKLDAAIRYALENNPDIRWLREQHGIAAAGIVIARTYPFNPIWQGQVMATNGPARADITNAVANVHKLTLDVEVKGQRFMRRDIAAANMSRTDWEIAFQELTLAVRVVRAYETVVYRYKKAQLIEQIFELNTKAAQNGEELFKKGTIKAPDLIALRTEVADYRTQRNAARQNLVMAWNELRRAMGLVAEKVALEGDLVQPPEPEPFDILAKTALERRPDLHARHAALAEAEARLKLEIANRHGNPSVGPVYEYNETSVNFIGGQIILPFPVFNRRQGEIQLREAESARARLDVAQTETHIRQDVWTALRRLEQARQSVEIYTKEVRPVMATAMTDMRNLFERGDQGVDALKLLDIQRKQLKATDGELDALWELRQAQADLAAAVADPSVAAFSPPAR